MPVESTTLQGTALAVVQLDDGRRAASAAAAAMRAIALDNPGSALGQECERLHGLLAQLGNEIAGVRDRVRVRGAA